MYLLIIIQKTVTNQGLYKECSNMNEVKATGSVLMQLQSTALQVFFYLGSSN